MCGALLSVAELAVKHRIFILTICPLLLSHIIGITLGQIELCCHNLSWEELGGRSGYLRPFLKHDRSL